MLNQRDFGIFLNSTGVIILMQKLLLEEGCYCNKNPKHLALVQQTVKMEINIQGYPENEIYTCSDKTIF